MSADPTTHRRFRTVPPDTRPEIVVGVDVERMANEAVAALALEARCYQRGGQLVHVVTVPQGPPQLVRGIKRYQGSHTIVHMPPPALYERLTSAANWRKLDGRTHEYRPVDAPTKVVAVVGARGQWDGLRPLVAVATCPQLRPDGSILQAPGYDEATGILYWPSDDFPEVPDQPTLEDARGALAALREVVCDFPFARPEHESAWLAGVLSMVARPAIEGPVPLFAIDATTRGTGKSRLVDAATSIAHGTLAARTSLPEDDDEMRKRISALVLDGDPAICIDNVTKPIALPSLDAVLTSTTWKDRLLGTMQNIQAPHRAVWWTTGNNLDLAGDLSRRALHVRLESPLENPEERADFHHPQLLSWVRMSRRRLVASALTLLRAFVVAKPDVEVSLWGSFEEWSALVPPALIWCGATSPLLARATANPELDDGKRALVTLIDGLGRLTLAAGRPLSVRHVLDALYPDRDPRDGPPAPDGFDDLRDVIEAETRCPSGRRPETRRLGKWLQRVRGRVVGGKRVARGGNDHDHAATWTVTE